MYAKNNLDSIQEEYEDNDDQTWIDGVSRINIEGDRDHHQDVDNGTCVQSAYRSVVHVTAEHKSSGKRDGFAHTSLSLTKEFLCDYWKDSTPNMRVSVQFQLESGYDAHRKLNIRVSTDGMDLVVTKKTSIYMMDPTKGLIERFTKDGLMDIHEAKNILKYHPRIIARKDSVAGLLKRDSNKKELDQTFRVPLPFKCRHKFTTPDDGDDFFHGVNFVKYENGEVWCHVELITQILDNYTFEQIQRDIKLMNEEVVGSDDDEDLLVFSNIQSMQGDPSVASYSPSFVNNSSIYTPANGSSKVSSRSSTRVTPKSSHSRRSAKSPSTKVSNGDVNNGDLKDPPSSIMFDSSSEATTNLQLVTKSVDGGSFKTPRDYDGSTVGSFDDSTISTRRTLRSKDTRITTRSIVSASSTPSYALTKSNHARRASYSLRKSDKKRMLKTMTKVAVAEAAPLVKAKAATHQIPHQQIICQETFLFMTCCTRHKGNHLLWSSQLRIFLKWTTMDAFLQDLPSVLPRISPYLVAKTKRKSQRSNLL